MRLTKLAAPVLASLLLAASAVAIADDPAATGAEDSTITVLVYGSDNALGSSCVISVDGDVLATPLLVPGVNVIEVLDTGSPVTVDGEEVLGLSVHPDNPGIN